ncbi:MAG: putative phosphate/phosphonate transporter, periplasmic ligand binding protein [Caulobacter sp.]|nr:putative phosphate/phosphonate transporter, periplasmic ligand binding protein [Caulobacter sp.]
MVHSARPLTFNPSRTLRAALPMYDLPELRAANDALWAATARRLAARGVAGVPDALTRDGDLDALWTAPDLLLAQACGYPLVTTLHRRVRLVATPRYRAKGCDGPYHRSVVVVRAGSPASNLLDLRGGVCAINAATSNTGMNLLRAAVAPLAQRTAFFGAVEITGAHLDSAIAVVEGRADLAAIDCVTFAHLQRWRPGLTDGLKVLAWTDRSPGLPLITAGGVDEATIAALGAALDEVAADPALRDVRRELLIDGFNPLPMARYRAALYLEQIAVDQGYPRLV